MDNHNIKQSILWVGCGSHEDASGGGAAISDNDIQGIDLIAHSAILEPINLGSSELVTINQLVDIAEEIGKRGIEIERSEIRLPDGPLRVIGEHQIELHLHTDVNVPLTVVIEAAEAANE